MATKVIYFVWGVVFSVFVVVIAGFYVTRPINILEGLPADGRVAFEMMYPWAASVDYNQIGSFGVSAPYSDEIGGLLVTPLGEFYPQVQVVDNVNAGKLSKVIVVDSGLNIILLEDRTGDNIFDYLSIAFGDEKHEVSLVDQDFDGVFDVRANPNVDPAVEVFHGGQWHKVINKKDGQYIRTVEGLTKIVLSGDGYKVIKKTGIGTR
jgi:hypothetical protein